MSIILTNNGFDLFPCGRAPSTILKIKMKFSRNSQRNRFNHVVWIKPGIVSVFSRVALPSVNLMCERLCGQLPKHVDMKLDSIYFCRRVHWNNLKVLLNLSPQLLHNLLQIRNPNWIAFLN